MLERGGLVLFTKYFSFSKNTHFSFAHRRPSTLEIARLKLEIRYEKGQITPGNNLDFFDEEITCDIYYNMAFLAL